MGIWFFLDKGTHFVRNRIFKKKRTVDEHKKMADLKQ